MNWVRRLLPYTVATGLLIGLHQSPLVETANLLIYDFVISLRGQRTTGSHPPITVIGIDETDLKTYGWPIADHHLCQAIETLHRQGALAIGLDLYRDASQTPADGCLSKLVKTNPRLISIANFAESISAIPGTPPNQQAFNDLVVDADRVVRRDLVHVGGQDEQIRSLPLRLLETATDNPSLHSQLESLPTDIWLQANSGGFRHLDASGYQTMLHVSPPGRFPLSTLNNLLEDRVPQNQILGRIVLIGSTAPSLKDQFEIPQSRFDRNDRFLELPGVELHAQRLESLQALLKSGRPQIMTATALQRSLLLGTMLLIGLLIGETPSRIRRSSLLLGLSALLLITATTLLLLQGTWIGLTMPLGGLVLFGGSGILRRGAISQQHQQQMRRLLGQATSPAVAKQLWEQRNDLIQDGRFAGRKRSVTLIFTDTCDFTRVSEELSPEDLMAWLNQGIGRCVDAVITCGGMVNKFTGDGMLAVFGAPVSQGVQQDAIQAIAAARKIQQAISSLNENELKSAGAAPMRMRIGIHSGVVLTGSLGSRERLEYAVIGDTVNCASRLESLEKERHQGYVRVLLSAETLRLVETSMVLDVDSWGETTVKGRREPLKVFELKDTEQAESSATSMSSQTAVPRDQQWSPGASKPHRSPSES